MKCPSCGFRDMAVATKDEVLTYKGHSVTLINLRGYFCTECGEEVWDEESYKRVVKETERLIDLVNKESTSIG